VNRNKSHKSLYISNQFIPDTNCYKRSIILTNINILPSSNINSCFLIRILLNFMYGPWNKNRIAWSRCRAKQYRANQFIRVQTVTSLCNKWSVILTNANISPGTNINSFFLIRISLNFMYGPWNKNRIAWSRCRAKRYRANQFIQDTNCYFPLQRFAKEMHLKYQSTLYSMCYTCI